MACGSSRIESIRMGKRFPDPETSPPVNLGCSWLWAPCPSWRGPDGEMLKGMHTDPRRIRVCGAARSGTVARAEGEQECLASVAIMSSCFIQLGQVLKTTLPRGAHTTEKKSAFPHKELTTYRDNFIYFYVKQIGWAPCWKPMTSHWVPGHVSCPGMADIFLMKMSGRTVARAINMPCQADTSNSIIAPLVLPSVNTYQRGRTSQTTSRALFFGKLTMDLKETYNIKNNRYALLFLSQYSPPCLRAIRNIKFGLSGQHFT